MREGIKEKTRQGQTRLTARSMLIKLANFAPVALILPLIGGGPFPIANDIWPMSEERQPTIDPKKLSAERTLLPAHYSTPVNFQVRIERRVVVRINPRATSARQSMLAELPTQPPPQRMVERKIGKCLPVRNIAAVQTGSGNRLLLFTRDQRIITAKLEKACRARDFYSGFYVEPNEDGMLCIDRDKLQSRAGANCELSRIRQLVPESE